MGELSKENAFGGFFSPDFDMGMELSAQSIVAQNSPFGDPTKNGQILVGIRKGTTSLINLQTDVSVLPRDRFVSDKAR